MDENVLFDEVLGLEGPWYVERTVLDPARRQLVVYLDFERGGTFTCRGCGTNGRKAYDTVYKQWRHLDFFHYRTFLYGPSPRVDCSSCGIRQAELPWARERQSMTLSFEQMVVSLSQVMSIRAAARLLGEHDTRLGRIVNHYRE